MRLSVASLAFLFLVERASLVQAGNSISWKRIVDASWFHRPEGHIDARTQQYAHAIMNRNLYHERDVIPSPTPITPNVKASPISTASAADKTDSWDKTTEAACLKAFKDRKDTTPDPSGMAACYNIKYFDNTTGVFQADLRLYRVSPATGRWATMKSDGVNIKLSCKGASIAAGKMQMGRRDDMFESWSQIQRLRIFRRSTPSPPKMLQQMDFYGEIHDDLMKQNQTGDSARSSLAPTIAFSATSADGTPLMTNLSANGTSFIHGVFAPAQLADSSSPGSRAPATTDQGFVMPGRKLGIFPVGLIITSVWTAMFLIAISVGTVDRVRFREAYRRRMKRELSLGVRTI